MKPPSELHRNQFQVTVRWDNGGQPVYDHRIGVVDSRNRQHATFRTAVEVYPGADKELAEAGCPAT